MNSWLTGPLAVLTGASNGIGYELAKQLAQHNFDLLVTATGPTLSEAAQAFEKLRRWRGWRQIWLPTKA